MREYERERDGRTERMTSAELRDLTQEERRELDRTGSVDLPDGRGVRW